MMMVMVVMILQFGVEFCKFLYQEYHGQFYNRNRSSVATTIQRVESLVVYM